MSTSQVQFSNIYNPISDYPLLNVSPSSDPHAFEKITNLAEGSENFLELENFKTPLIFNHIGNTISFTFKDEPSGLVLTIKPKFNDSFDGGNLRFESYEPTVNAGVLSSRILYLLFSAGELFLLAPDGNKITFSLDSFPENERQKLLYRAKIFRKLLFIEKCLSDKLSQPICLPKEISSEDIAHIDTVFRGLTRGNVFTEGEGITLYKNKPFDQSIQKYILENLVPKPISFNLNGIHLFGDKLPLGAITGFLTNALLTNTEEVKQAFSDSADKLEFHFSALDNRIIFHFKEHIQKLSQNNALLNTIKKELSDNEPEELSDLLIAPMVGDINTIEAAEIATGWIHCMIPGPPWPASQVYQTDLSKDGTYWVVSMLLKENNKESPIKITINRKLAKIIDAPSQEKLNELINIFRLS